ncbi:MAG: TRAP transporter large permease [Burkholderiaceae bacterium]|nr:TRAP transporter large permease [Burkholderiaceae bacterium]MCD8536844.1 TRAP transporter large permease [Burkholderiaceae bacterium]MCD8565484.1 TRAP transporter large permease [Burkholderiaceae bacterium]
MEIALPILTLLFLLVLGLPVAVSLALAGALGIFMLNGVDSVVGILATAPGSALGSYELLTIPMFVLMAELMGLSGISSDLFRAVAVWTNRLKGGVGISTVITGALFGAVSGSSTAAAATLAKTAIPSMLSQNYQPGRAAGITAMAGTIAMLIPPSVALIFYGLLSGVNISALLIAGIVPGLLVTLVLSLVIRVTVRNDKLNSDSETNYSWADRFKSLKVAVPFVALFGAVTGLIYTGVATPVESSAIGAFAALVYTVLNRTCSWSGFKTALINTCAVTAMIGLIIVCAQIFGYFVTMSRFAHDLASFVGASDLPVWAFMAIIIVLYLVLGLFLDLISILILTVPIMMPIVAQLGLDPIWFGIIVILLAEIGIVTPPVGMNVFVVSKISAIPLNDCFAGVVVPVIALLGLIIVLVIWPEITLWLPSTMN